MRVDPFEALNLWSGGLVYNLLPSALRESVLD